MSIDLELLKSYDSSVLSADKYKSVRYWCQDESRFDLHTITGREITAMGVKPVGKVQWLSDRYYLYELIEPKSGENFFYEFSHMDSACFQIYLQEFESSLSRRFTHRAVGQWAVAHGEEVKGTTQYRAAVSTSS